MSETPVRRIVVSDPLLSEPVSVDLPWDLMPPSMRGDLDRLDVDNNQEIAYTPERGPIRDRYLEVLHSDRTASDLTRLLWRFSGDYPSNDRRRDAASYPDRHRLMETVQNRLYERAVLPVLGGLDGTTDRARWEKARRILELTGDAAHLYRLSQVARGLGIRTEDRAYLEIEEEYLLTAERLAAGTPAGRRESLDGIQTALREVSLVLDREEGARFRADLEKPYLLATTGSPVTADVSHLSRGDLIWFGVAVPSAFVQQNREHLREAIRGHFSGGEGITLQGSAFRDQVDRELFNLEPAEVELDRPDWRDDRIGQSFSFHLQQERLNRTVFRGREMTYYRVGFRLPEAAAAMAGRETRKFDLVFQRGGHEHRRVSGGFVLQDKFLRPSRDLFASDIHVSRRAYEVVKVMGESLRREGTPLSRSQIEEIERFYESVNEKVEAAVEIWNQWYREGRIDRVFITGDLADFVNVADTLERQGYRGTNIRTLKRILGKLETPLYVVSGNHDHHGFPFPYAWHVQGFDFAEGLQDLYADHYDERRIGGGNSIFNGVKALLPETCGGTICALWKSFLEANAEDPFSRQNDDFLDHHLRELAIYEPYSVNLGNRTRVFLWPTETEDFNYVRHLETGAHPPLREEIFRGARTYYEQQHPNGKGPRPEVFMAFLRELEEARGRGERLILAGHYPPFYSGTGPDRVPDSEDTLRGDVAVAVRLAAWYYRSLQDTSLPVLSISIGGHVHKWTETDVTFNFTSEEERTFRAALGRIFAARNPETLYDSIHDLRHDWDLDHRMNIRRVGKDDAGSDGFPGPVVDEFNLDSQSYGQQRGTLFVTLPAAGPKNKPGFAVLTTEPDGRSRMDVYFFQIRQDGRVVLHEGSQFEQLRRDRYREARDWDRERRMEPFRPARYPTQMELETPEAHDEPNPDWLPLMCQYTRGNICLDLDMGAGISVGSGDLLGLPMSGSLPVGGQIVFSRTLFVPHSSRLNTFLGSPNDLRVGADYDLLQGRTRFRIGTDIGIPQVFLFGDTDFDERHIVGLELRATTVLPILPIPGRRYIPLPGVYAWGGVDLDGHPAGGFGLRFGPTLLGYRPEDHEHH